MATSADERLPSSGTPPVGESSVGIYLIAGRPEDVPFEQVPLADFTLADEPLIRESDIFEHDWESHTIRLKQQALADRILNRRGVGDADAFVVVANGQRLYAGVMMSLISSYLPSTPVIHVGPTASQFQPQMAVRICAPPIAGSPDPRVDPRLRDTLRALHLLSRSDTAGLSFDGLSAHDRGRPVRIETNWRVVEQVYSMSPAGFFGMENGHAVFTGVIDARGVRDDNVVLVASADLLNTAPQDIPADQKVDIPRTAIRRIDEAGPASMPAMQPVDRLTRLSRHMLRHRLTIKVDYALELNRPGEQLSDPNDMEKVLADTATSAPLGTRRLAAARLVQWAGQEEVLQRLAELARSEDGLVSLHAMQVMAVAGQGDDVEYLHELASGRRVLSSSEFERDDAAWALLALGQKLPAAANNHSAFLDKTLEDIRTVQQSGEQMPGDLLSRLEEEVFLRGLAVRLFREVGGRWLISRNPVERGPTLMANFTTGDAFTAYVIYPSRWTVQAQAQWNSGLASTYYRAIASGNRCTLLLTGQEDRDVSDRMIQVLGLRRLSPREALAPPAQPGS